MEGNMAEILEVASNSVNVKLVIVLIVLGAILKHLIKQVDNGIIPIIIVISGIIISLVITIDGLPSNWFDSVVSGCVSGGVAIGMHSTGKSVYELLGFKNFVTNKISSDTESK